MPTTTRIIEMRHQIGPELDDQYDIQFEYDGLMIWCRKEQRFLLVDLLRRKVKLPSKKWSVEVYE